MPIEKIHEVGDGLVFENIYDDTQYLKYAEDMRSIVSSKPVDGLGYYAGTIPPFIVEQYMHEHGVSYEEIIGNNEHIHRILNNPDFKKFRVWEGKV